MVSVGGRSDDGKEYSGTVTIATEGEDYKLNWKVGDSEYEGDGTLDGNLLTVNWGSSTPVVYAVAEDGTLKGLWAGGHRKETLTPEQ